MSRRRHPEMATTQLMKDLTVLLVCTLVVGCRPSEPPVKGLEGDAEEALILRIATFNVGDLQTAELLDPTRQRPRRAAAILQQIRPDIVLINEIAYDQPGGPDWIEAEPPGQNGQRFADLFLARPQGEDLDPIRYTAFMSPVNTGVASDLDLDNDGQISVTPVVAQGSRSQEEQTAAGRAYGQDAWGFGTYPGQFGMALLVREGMQILLPEVRTFQRFPWSRMPGALLPLDPASGESWYSVEEWSLLPLSSKSHWDVPIRLPGRQILHILASHPTPPVFDGPEIRNRKRNHDEIRFWVDYLEGAEYIEDDNGQPGGLQEDRLFVLLGDLNADPEGGRSIPGAIKRLLAHDRVSGRFVPEASPESVAAYPDLERTDTAVWGLRVDYVLPSSNLEILDGGVWRHSDGSGSEVSDHFPVWLDIAVPVEGGSRTGSLGSSDELARAQGSK
jgi:hypothetical protein